MDPGGGGHVVTLGVNPAALTKGDLTVVFRFGSRELGPWLLKEVQSNEEKTK